MSKDDDFNSPDYDDAVRKALNEKITFTQNGKSRTVTKAEAVIERRTASALAGNTHAQRQVLADTRRIEEQEHKKKMIVANFWRKYKRHQEKVFADHVKAHGVEPLEFPHPLDIEIDEDDNVRCLGPQTLEDHHKVLQTLKEIEAILHQSALERRLEKLDFEHVMNPDDPMHTAVRFSLLVPPRLRHTADTIVARLMELEQKTKLELLRDTYQAWRRTHHDRPRGWRWCTQRVSLLSEIADRATDWMRENQDLDPNNYKGQLNAHVLELAQTVHAERRLEWVP